MELVVQSKFRPAKARVTSDKALRKVNLNAAGEVHSPISLTECTFMRHQPLPSEWTCDESCKLRLPVLTKSYEFAGLRAHLAPFGAAWRQGGRGSVVYQALHLWAPRSRWDCASEPACACRIRHCAGNMTLCGHIFWSQICLLSIETTDEAVLKPLFSLFIGVEAGFRACKRFSSFTKAADIQQSRKTFHIKLRDMNICPTSVTRSHLYDYGKWPAYWKALYWFRQTLLSPPNSRNTAS